MSDLESYEETMSQSKKELGADFVDNFSAKFGLGPKYKSKSPTLYICPKCKSNTVTIKEIHPDTDMNEIVGVCSGCSYIVEEEKLCPA